MRQLVRQLERQSSLRDAPFENFSLVLRHEGKGTPTGRADG